MGGFCWGAEALFLVKVEVDVFLLSIEKLKVWKWKARPGKLVFFVSSGDERYIGLNHFHPP